MKLIVGILALFVTLVIVDGKRPPLRCSMNCKHHRKNPVCDTSGVEYPNMCTMKQEECKQSRVIKKGHCPASVSQRKCIKQCFGIPRNTVCTDKGGMEFKNLCEFERYICKNNADIKKVKCKRAIFPIHPPMKCKKCWGKPKNIVCTDKRKFRNQCELDRFVCMTNTNIKKVECGKEVCPTFCPNFLHHSVCDSEGTKYTNICNFKKAKCRNKNLERVSCNACHQMCTKEMNEVCGTDRKTYNNPCLLDYETCVSDGKIRLAYEGKCKIVRLDG